MTAQAWVSLVGVTVTVLLAIIPWMLAVHARLAVLASRIAGLDEKLEKIGAASERRLEMCINHQSRLDTFEVQIGDIAERLRDFELGE